MLNAVQTWTLHRLRSRRSRSYSTIWVCITIATSLPSSVSSRVCQTWVRVPVHRRRGRDHCGASLAPPMKLVLLSIVVCLGILRQIDHGRRSADRIRKRHDRAAVNGVVKRAQIRPHQHVRDHAIPVASVNVTPSVPQRASSSN